MNQDQSNRALNKQTPPTGPARPAESAALANVVRADSAPSSVLSINGGSSSIRFAVYEKGESPRRLLEGKVDRVGQSGTNLTFTDATGEPQNRRAIESEDPDATVAFLLEWLEAQPVFASVIQPSARPRNWPRRRPATDIPSKWTKEPWKLKTTHSNLFRVGSRLSPAWINRKE
jgi:hypothetical protein